MKKIKSKIFIIILTSMLTLLPVFVGTFSWNTLPDELPIHFNFSGEAYGYADKLEVIIILPVFLLIMHLIIAIATIPDPTNSKNAISGKVYSLLLFIAPIVSLFCTIMIFGEPLNFKIDFMTIIQVFFAVLYLILGNYLPKMRRNKFVGTKLPWTAKSDYNWDKTNRLAGWLFFISGLAFAINTFIKIGKGTGIFILWLVTIVLVTVAPTIYSYVISRNENKRQ